MSLAAAPPPVAAADAPQRHETMSQQTRTVAERYFLAYIDRRWDDLEPLLADRASFRDPTASRVFGSTEKQGKAAMMTAFREGYAALTEMRFARMRQFAFGEWALFEGDLAWTLRLPDGRLVSSVTPIATTLRVESGLVTEHVDLVDYQPFVDAVRKSRAPAGS